MSETTHLLLEAAVADLQHAATTGEHKDISPVTEFTDTMLQIAETTRCVACTLQEENRLYVLIEDEAPYVYEFLTPWAFRSVLASVASLVWHQNPQVPGHEAFNPYGDRKEIEHTNSNGITTRFFYRNRKYQRSTLLLHHLQDGMRKSSIDIFHNSRECVISTEVRNESARKRAPVEKSYVSQGKDSSTARDWRRTSLGMTRSREL